MAPSGDQFTAIKILKQGLPVIGFAKIGEGTPKSSKLKGAPVKFDHIELTGRERDSDNRLCPDVPMLLKLLKAGAKTCGGCDRSKHLAALHKIPEFGQGLPTELGILLPYDDMKLNFSHRLACWRGATLFCHGDGEAAERREVMGKKRVEGKDIDKLGDFQPYTPCGPRCEYFQNRRCKPQGRLRFVLGLQANVGGCYEFRTTSWNSIANLHESLKMIQQLSGGVLQWIPLRFDVVPQTVKPKDGGPPSTARVACVTFPGTPAALLQSVHSNLKLRAPILHEIKQLEASISRDWEMTPQEVEDLRQEFDHDNLVREDGEIIDATTGEVVSRSESSDPGTAEGTTGSPCEPSDTSGPLGELN